MKYLMLALLSTGILVQAQNMGIMGGNFVAPTINGRANVFNPSVGEIIYDSSNDTFYGYDASSVWIALSGSAGSSLPAGTVLAFAGSTCPTGFIPADGTSYPTSTYPDLFAEIGYSHGGATGTYYVPDYRGRFLRGVDGSAGRDPNDSARTAMNAGGNTGDNVGSIQSDAFQGHWHAYANGGGA